jgi:hypothetical protein
MFEHIIDSLLINSWTNVVTCDTMWEHIIVSILTNCQNTLFINLWHNEKIHLLIIDMCVFIASDTMLEHNNWHKMWDYFEGTQYWHNVWTHYWHGVGTQYYSHNVRIHYWHNVWTHNWSTQCGNTLLTQCWNTLLINYWHWCFFQHKFYRNRKLFFQEFWNFVVEVFDKN